MFDNVGEKIKGVAIVLNIIGTISSIIVGLILFTNQEPLAITGILIMVIGCMLSWMSAYLLYGFGQLIQNSDFLVRAVQKHNIKHPQNISLSNTAANISADILYISKNKLSNETLNGVSSKCDICKNSYLVTYDSEIHKTTGIEKGKVCNNCIDTYKKQS